MTALWLCGSNGDVRGRGWNWHQIQIIWNEPASSYWFEFGWIILLSTYTLAIPITRIQPPESYFFSTSRFKFNHYRLNGITLSKFLCTKRSSGSVTNKHSSKFVSTLAHRDVAPRRFAGFFLHMREDATITWVYKWHIPHHPTAGAAAVMFLIHRCSIHCRGLVINCSSLIWGLQ